MRHAIWVDGDINEHTGTRAWQVRGAVQGLDLHAANSTDLKDATYSAKSWRAGRVTKPWQAGRTQPCQFSFCVALPACRWRWHFHGACCSRRLGEDGCHRAAVMPGASTSPGWIWMRAANSVCMLCHTAILPLSELPLLQDVTQSNPSTQGDVDRQVGPTTAVVRKGMDTSRSNMPMLCAAACAMLVAGSGSVLPVLACLLLH